MQKSLDENVWIGLWDEAALLEAAFFTEFRLPDGFRGLPYAEVWDSMSYGSLRDLMTRDQFQEMQKLHGKVRVAANHSLTEVYLSSFAKQELDGVKAKLDVLLRIKVPTLSMDFKRDRGY